MISTEPKEEKIKISSQNNFNRTFYTFNYTDYIENIITLILKTKEIKKIIEKKEFMIHPTIHEFYTCIF